MKIIALGFLLLPIAGHTQELPIGKRPIYIVEDNQTEACPDKESFNRPWTVDHRPQAPCVLIPAGTALRSDGSEGNYAPRFLLVTEVGDKMENRVPFYIQRSDVKLAKESPMDAFDVPCTQDGGGGEVQRVVTDAQGRVYIKRYILTSECHNGKLMQRTRPLN